MSDAMIQKEIAYAIIVVARQENNLISADSQALRQLYGVNIRNESEFKMCTDMISQTLPNDALNL